MTPAALLQTVTAIFISLGVGNMIFAALKIRQLIELKYELSDTSNWRIVLYLIFFFLAAYLTAIIILLYGSSNLLLVTSGIILLLEAVFIFRLSDVTYATIVDLVIRNLDLQDGQSIQDANVAARIAQLKAVNEVGQTASAILDPAVLMSTVANMINDHFGFYYTAIFLVDKSGSWAELQYATGEAGRVLTENHHRLEVGGPNMVGTAISSGGVRVANIADNEPVRYNNPLLPYTRADVALSL